MAPKLTPEQMEKKIDELESKIKTLSGKAATSAGSVGGAGDLEKTMNGMSSLAGEVESLYNKLDSARAGFSSFTGLANEGVPVLRKYSSSVRGLGIDYETSSRNLQQLVEGVPDFLNKSQEMQTSMAMQSARLSKLGVDFATNAKNMTTMTKTLGMTDQETMKFNGTLFKFANSLKQPPSVIFKEFGAALPKLIQFGKAAPKVFMETEVYAKKLGISVESLIDQMGQFDTFEDAAESAGKLNVILGENLFDTEAMLFAQPGEKVQMFVDKMQEFKNRTGQSFNDLDIFTQRQFAKSAGMDLDTLKKLSGLSAKEAKELAARKDSVQMNADGSAELQKAAAAATSTVDRLAAKKDQLAGLALPFADIKTSLEASVAQTELLTKAFVGLAKADPGTADAFKNLLSQQTTDKMVSDSGIGNIKVGFEDVLKDLPAGLGTAFQKIVPLLDDAAKKTLLFEEGGVKKLLSMNIGGIDLAKAAGFTDEQIVLFQKQMDAKRNMIQKGREGVVTALGGTPESAQKMANLRKEADILEGRVVIKTTEEALKLAADLKKEINENVKAEEEKAKNEGREPRYTKALVEGMSKGFVDAFAQIPNRLQALKESADGKRIAEISQELGSFAANEVGGVFELLTKVLDPSNPLITGLSNAAAASIPMAESALTTLATFISNANANLGPGLPTFNSNIGALSTGMSALNGTLPNFSALGDPALGVTIGSANTNATTIGTTLSTVNSYSTTGTGVPTYIDSLARSTGNLATNLTAVESKISVLEKLKFDATQAANIKALGDAMDQYVDALKAMSTLSDEQDKFIKAMEALTGAMAGKSFEIKLDESKLGDAIARGVRGGATGTK
jgi:hypothetical protein